MALDMSQASSQSTTGIVPKIVPKIVIDARMLGDIPHGIARHLEQIARALRAQITNSQQALPYEPIFLVNRTYKAKMLEPFQSIQTEAAFLHPREWIEIPRILKKTQAALYHSPSLSALWSCPCPSLVTLHDLNHLHFGSPLQKLYYQSILKRFTLRSEKILTVSDFSRREIMKWLNKPSDKIALTPNVLEPKPKLSSEKTRDVLNHFRLHPKKYFFCLSNPKKHKNLRTLLLAYKSFTKKNFMDAAPVWPLVLSITEKNLRELLADCPKWTQSEINNSPKDVLALGSLNETEAGELLRQAAGSFSPALYEGFGLAPLEAAITGTPVFVSNIPPHKESFESLPLDSVFWAEAKSIEDWTRAFSWAYEARQKACSETIRAQLENRFSLIKLIQALHPIYLEYALPK